MSTKTVRLLLVGGGHGHLHVLKQLQKVRLPHTHVTLVSPSRFQYYSGMFAGFIEGTYSLGEIRIDLPSLAQNAGVDWIEGHAQHVDPENNLLLTENGDQLPFDFISFDIGSLTAGVDIPGVKAFNRVIKPNYLLPRVFEELRSCNNLSVVGGGAAGIEMSLALQSWRKANQVPGIVRLVSSGPLLKQEGPAVSATIEAIVESKGVKLYAHQRVREALDGTLVTSTDRIPFDELLWLAGPAPHSIFRQSGLPVDKKGYLLVNDTLQTVNYPHIFGIGDCITLENHPNVPKAGVYAVKQARTLWANLMNVANRGSLYQYRPQRQKLSILSTGDEQAFLVYRGTSFHGHFAWCLKRQIDRTFVMQYQQQQDSNEFVRKTT